MGQQDLKRKIFIKPFCLAQPVSDNTTKEYQPW
jgi:hypothetical protein